MTLQPNVVPTLERSLNEKPVTEKAVDRILSDQPAEKTPAEKILSSAAALTASGVTPLSPSALSAAVAPSPSMSRVNLRVVPNPSPLAASLPAAAAARIADAPMVAPPMAPAPANIPPPTPIAPVSSAPTPRHEEHNFRVLVVDDSPLMRTFMQNKLQPYGISPEFASSGEEALFKISKQHFDMIFLDVMLPGMDGYDVCKMIKKNKDNSLMKVVMLTSKDKTFDKIRGTMAGCDGYLTKPVDEMKLRSIIERHTVTK
jgi:CheY-like chemotaxis protein